MRTAIWCSAGRWTTTTSGGAGEAPTERCHLCGPRSTVAAIDSDRLYPPRLQYEMARTSA